jgi:preprotein translocase subunit SecB
MSDIDSSAIGNGAPQGNDPANPEDLPQFRILAQYIKDFSFENPGAPDSLRPTQEQPQTDVGIDVQAKRREGDEFEAVIRLNITSRRDDDVSFILELVYGGVFVVKNVPQESLQPLLLIECPRMLFPFLRRVVADITRDGGFAPLMLDPIDFAALYRNQMEQAARQQQEQAGGAPVGQPN